MISILCAEDDPNIQMLYRTILSQRDYDVRVLGDGTEAVAAFTETPADLVLLDMQMPVMSGIETCQKIRQLPGGARVPILIVSSRDTEDEITGALSAGADDYILKPFKSSEILAKVNYAIRKRRAGVSDNLALSYTDQYEIVRKIDDGSLTTVYLARDTKSNPTREVALKIFNPGDSAKESAYFKTLFLREAYEWSKLQHKHIVQLYDFGQSSGSYYLVLEFIEGTTLWDRVEEHGPMRESALLSLAYQMTLALQHIVDFGMVHRDIKPNNILLSVDGEVKLTDFGLAKQTEDTKITIMHNVFKGTPDFVSPEQIEGKEILDIRSDIYSLGATLYYAATQGLPFRDASLIGTLNNHFRITPAPVKKTNKAYSKGTSDLIEQMLAKHKEDRCTIDELKSKLESLTAALKIT